MTQLPDFRHVNATDVDQAEALLAASRTGARPSLRRRHRPARRAQGPRPPGSARAVVDLKDDLRADRHRGA